MKNQKSKIRKAKKLRRLVPRSEARRHYAVEALPESIQLKLVEKLRDGETYDSIKQWLADQKITVTISALGRYFHGRVKPEFEEMKETIRKRRLLVAELMEMWKRAAPEEQPPELIKQLLLSGIVANETSMTQVSPARLLSEQNKQGRLAIEQERLKLDREKHEFELKKRADQSAQGSGDAPVAQVHIYIADDGRNTSVPREKT